MQGDTREPYCQLNINTAVHLSFGGGEALEDKRDVPRSTVHRIVHDIAEVILIFAHHYLVCCAHI